MSASGQTDPGRATLLSKLLDGWTPDIDARRNDKPCIVSGQNFRDTLDGPASAWANEFVNFNNFDAASRIKISELRITNGFLYGTPTGVYKINPVSGLLEPLLTIPDITITNIHWPWTIAFVGGLYYLAQYDVGLWQYNDVSETLTQISTPLGTTIRGVVADHGRLVMFSDSIVANSSLDNGTDFAPSLSTGAGGQNLAIIGGTPLKLETVTDGFLLYLTKGMLKGNWSTAAYVYTHTKHSESVKLFSPNASVNVPGLGCLALDNNGFWLTKEYNYETYGYPSPWDPEKSDYIKKNILAAMDENLYGTVMLYYSKALQVLFIQFASNLLQGFFQTTFCWDMVSKRWSSINFPHYGIFETYSASNNQYSCSFMDATGYMHAFREQNFSEDFPDLPLQIVDFIWRPGETDDIVRRIVDADLNSGLPFDRGNTEIMQSDANPFAYASYTVPGIYSINAEPYSDTITTPGDPDMNVSGSPIIGYTNIDMFNSGGIELIALPYILPSKALDSNIVIGPWRFNTQTTFAEQASAVESIMLGMNNVVGFQIFEDWNELTATEDWNALSGAEDWAAGGAFPNIYEVELTSTNDGWSIPIQGVEELEKFIDTGSTQLYKPNGWEAIYHTIKICADEVNDCFNLKTIDITTNLTGVYQSDQGG